MMILILAFCKCVEINPKKVLVLYVLFHYSIDATRSERLGKYVNDSLENKNALAKPFQDSVGNWRLGLFALPDRGIEPLTEIRYSYGTESSEFWWRTVKNSSQQTAHGVHQINAACI